MIARVLLGQVRVGTLERQSGGDTVFRFDAEYLAAPRRPVLGRAFEDHLGPSFELREKGRLLPAFFQNYLPDDGSALRQMLAGRLDIDPGHEVPLLFALGEDLAGALIVRAEKDDDAPPSTPPTPGGPVEEDAPLHFSLAGLQLKFSVLPAGQRFTVPLTGVGGRWIAKMPDPRFAGVPAHEHGILDWAAETGLNVPERRLTPISSIDGLPARLTFSEPYALLVRRYDRADDGARIHQEDFAQVLGVRPADKYRGGSYATIANIVRQVAGESDYEELVRRLVFLVLSGNADGHLKNWSLVYPDGRNARLAPAYDLVCTLAYGPVLSRRLALSFVGNKEFDRVELAHFERMAVKVGADPARTRELVQATSARARDAWRRLRLATTLPVDTVAAIEKHLDSVRL